MSTTANYASTPKVGLAQLSVANTARDGTGTLGVVFTAGTSGSRIDVIQVQATGTTTAGTVRLFIHNGSSSFLISELPIVAVTPSGTIPAFSVTASGAVGNLAGSTVLPLIIPNGYSLRASTNNAEAFTVIAYGADF